MKFSFRLKRTKRRVLSLLIVVVLLSDMIPAELFPGLHSSSLTMEVSAAEEYSPKMPVDYFSPDSYSNTKTISFSRMSDFLDYCYHYNYSMVDENNSFAKTHQYDTLQIPFTDDENTVRGIIPDTFTGLGTAEFPFGGTIEFNGDTVILQAHRSIFNYVYDSVCFRNSVTKNPLSINLVRLTDVSGNKPLIADYVVHKEGATSAEWNIINGVCNNETGEVVNAGCTYSGVIGEMGANAKVKLNFTNHTDKAIVNNNNSDTTSLNDVGAICGVMNNGSEIQLSYVTTKAGQTVTSANGNAGGLVGTMNGNAVLRIISYPAEISFTVTAARYAGGLVGELTSDATITTSVPETTETVSQATISNEVSLLTEETTAEEMTQEISEEPTTEAAEESTEESTEEPTTEATEESTEESTEEPTIEAAGESTVESTEEPTTEAAEESTVESTEESTTEATEESTEESTTEATEESTEEVTAEPTEEALEEPVLVKSARFTAEPSVETSEEEILEHSSAMPMATLFNASGAAVSTPLSVQGNITGNVGAGGLFGHYTNTKDEIFDLSSYQINTTVYGQYCGGVFGVLENNRKSDSSATSLTLKNTNKAAIATVNSGTATTYEYTGYFGGIAGKYSTDDLTNSLVLDTLTISATANSKFNAFGGAIGIVDSAAYVKTDIVTVNAGGTGQRRELQEGTCDNYAFFGGLVGATSKQNGVMIDLRNFTLNASLNGSENAKYGFFGGGVVGQFYHGVLRLSGITDMRNAIPDGGYQSQESNAIRQSFYAQLVGYNDNVLVYALGDGSTESESASYGNGWRYLRSNGAVADDLGIWGQVVRVFQSGDTYVNAETAGILVFDGTNHTVTVAAAVTEMDSSVAFAKTALNIMLNNKEGGYDCLLFSGATENTRDTILSSNALSISADISADIDLSRTGINGFMRDGVEASSNKPDSFGDIGTFTGTLEGNDKTIRLAIGESYGVYTESATEGSGQVYRHQFNGLFSVIGDGNTGTGTVQNLTVAGNITLHNAGANGMNVAGIAARSHGNTTLSGVTVSHSVNYFENSTLNSSYVTAELGKNVGGLIGYVDKNSDGNGTISIFGTTIIEPTFNFGGRYKNWLMYGGAIGSVASSKVQINIAQNQDDTCTVKMKANVSDGTAYENRSVSGGLIGYIHTNLPTKGSYNDKVVNIGNLVYDDCTIACPSRETGGGLLGYSWYNTSVNINGLVVSDATLNYVNSAQNVGIMCYDATGKWTVDSMKIEKLSVETGGSVSLGMIVNKAYQDDDRVTVGLYLDVLNSGYKLTDFDSNSGKGITLPESIGVYDEIAAYSAKDVLAGNRGVVSINMNADRQVDNAIITSTGTYQNQLTGASCATLNSEKYANPYTRYYYNLDKMSKDYPGQNLVLWSVNRYAAANINKEFDTDIINKNKILTGAADLSGLSFYPLSSVDIDYTIKDLTLTFDYNGLLKAESISDSDVYVRDSAGNNQHYLMHSGLFIDLPAGKTITISGPFAIGGTFLEDDSHQGVLISGTMSGKLTCTDGATISLNGIKPKSGSEAYTKGYLLISKIQRNSDTIAPELLLKNLTTTEAYSANDATPTVAKSLIGPASGKELKIEFSGIKLDARDGNSTDEGLKGQAATLYGVYGTHSSIFTDSTLLASIHTDQSAVLLYNYTYKEDWGTPDTGAPRNVTYGKEVTASSEYPGQEQQYYGVTRWFTNPVDNTERTTAYDFSQGFLPYVFAGYSSEKDSAGLYRRELKVNVMTEGLTAGCGTYNDPYLITNEKQLEDVASFIKSGLPDSLTKIQLPKNYENFKSLEANTSGERWCDDKTGDGFHAIYEYNNTTKKYVSSKEDTQAWEDIKYVQYYLTNAYYKISGDIVLSNSFVGLGGTSPNTAFRGVIVGGKKADGTLYTITNKSDKPFIDVSNGCVVKDVNIVVANEDITLKQDSKGSDNAYFDYNSLCKYYGGIIGEIMGGDNIIDNSYVSYQYIETDAENNTINKKSTIKLSGTYGMLCPVGSYVGVVVFGGLIFKNMTTNTVNENASNLVVNYYKTTNNNITTDGVNLALEQSTGAIYVNPLVGRVINGYAVNETTQFSVTEKNEYHDDTQTHRDGQTHSLKNTTKHYTIADIKIEKDPNELLEVSAIPSGIGEKQDGTIYIPNSQAFFILSLITQSCAGTAPTAGGNYSSSLSYGTNTIVYGMSHIADYTKVGVATDVSEPDYAAACGDTAANTAVPYIIMWYTKPDTSNNYPARCVTRSNNDNSNGYYNINLKEGVSYILPDSFRGLGCVGKNNLRYNMKVNVFDGKNCAIDVDIYLNRYGNTDAWYDNYFNKMHNDADQFYKDTNTDYNANTNTNSHGIGLFDSIFMKGENAKLSNFTLSGSVNTENYELGKESTGAEKKGVNNNCIHWLVTGGVCGWSRQDYWCNFESVKLNNLTVSGATQTGGLLAASGLKSDTTRKIKITNCSADELSVEITSGYADDYRNVVGGFVGKVDQGKVVIDGGTGQTVKLKSVKVGLNNLRSVAGGLVAYAGNGCEVTNMKICPADSLEGKSVDVGADGIAMSGGIVGLMQPAKENESTCTASFVGCEVEKINVLAANYAGGFYGGTWDSGWSPFSIKIDNCKMTGDANTKNKIQAKKRAGGFVADGYVVNAGSPESPNILIKESKISNYIIDTKDSDSYSGGFIGYADCKQGAVVCYIHDGSIENCQLATSGQYGGGAIGRIINHPGNQILGYNIKLDNVTSKEGTKKMGAWIGYLDTSDTNTSIQFTGMAIYGTGFSKNIGNWEPGKTLNNANFVFADYMNACKGKQTSDSEGNSIMVYPNDVSGLNATANVSMPLYPYVNINPQSNIGEFTTTDDHGVSTTKKEVISGDGAVLLSDNVTDDEGNTLYYTGSKTRAAQIYADIKTGTDSRRYTTFRADDTIIDDKTIEHYLQCTAGSDGDRISTYKTEVGSLPNGVDDFAVIVIANTNNTETTNLINRYIQLVTNTTTDYTAKSNYYDIVVKSCKYNEDEKRFVVTDDERGLAWVPPSSSQSGSFALNGKYADSKKENTFNLVDVQFKDPLHTDKIAYHLYVPVYTIKQIEVDFSVAVKTGTSSVAYSDGTPSSLYSDSMVNGTHIDGMETWITQYIRYTYSKDDLDVLLDTGNLKWNHKKTVIFDTQIQTNDVKIPEGSYLLLVDPNGGSDKEYYARASDFDSYVNPTTQKNGWEIVLSKFKNGEKSFDEQWLAHIIAPYLQVADNQGKGSYTDGSADDYDAYRIGEGGVIQYFKYVSTKTGKYDLSVGPDSVNEDYYISMYVPATEIGSNNLYYYTITNPSLLTGQKSAKVNRKNYYNVLIADLYTQETSTLTVAPDDQQISASNNALTIKAATSIYINNPYAVDHLKNTKLYHSFNINLNRYTETGVTSDIYGLTTERVIATYSYGTEANESSTAVKNIDLQSNYLNIETAEIMNSLVNASSSNPLVISSYIVLNFDEDKLEAEFPQKSSDNDIGVNVAVRSNLAYDETRLAYTSMTKSFAPDNHYYYRESVNSAILYYSSIDELDEYESYGKMSQNQSRLGLNGYCSDKNEMPIYTVAKYNVSAISAEDLANAAKLRLTFSLSKKTDLLDEQGKIVGVEYKQVEDMRNYLNAAIAVSSGTSYDKTHSIAEQPKALVADIPIENCNLDSDIYTFNIGFAAKTGAGFTEYANYRVTVRAELINASGNTIQNSGASDYIIYTNAKIYPEVLTGSK